MSATVFLVGNLGSDPELRYSQDGKPSLRVSVASSYRVRESNGEWVNATEWFRVTVFGPRAESLSNLLTKGMKVAVTGRLEARPWADRENKPRAGLEVIANEVEFLSPRQEQGDGSGYTQQHVAGYPSRGPSSPQAVAQQAQRRAPVPDDNDLLDPEDTLPF